MKPIPIIIGTVVVGSIAYIAKNLYKKYRKLSQEPNTQDSRYPAIQHETENDEFHAEFVKIADNFESFYHTLFTVYCGNENKFSQEELIDIIYGWQLNIKSSSKGPVKRTWIGLMQNYFHQQWFVDENQKDIGQLRTFLIKWYQILHNVGIKQDNRENIKVEDYTLHHYYVIPGIYDIGDDLEVERPCWTLNNKCIEKGSAKIIRKQE